MDDRSEQSQWTLSENPWSSLTLAALAAPPLGSIIVSVGLHFATPHEIDRSLTDSVLIGLYLSSLGYLIAVPVVTLYGSFYNPGIAGSNFPAWSCLIGSAIATSVFIYDGYYRRKPKR